MLGRLLQENDKKMSKLDKLARDQDLLQQLELHGLEARTCYNNWNYTAWRLCAAILRIRAYPENSQFSG